MYKTISYWTAPQPENQAAFEEFYQQVHGPMAPRVPGVQKLELSLADEGVAGDPSPFYRVAEMYFHDREAMGRATRSAEWAELGENAGVLIQRFNVALKTGHGPVVESPLAPNGPRAVISENLQSSLEQQDLSHG